MSETTDNTAAPRRGRRWLRWTSIIVGLLLVLLVTAYFVGTSSAFFKGVILPKVGKALNSDVTVGDASISPFSSVTLKDFKLQPVGKDSLFTAKEIRLRYRLMDIIGGNLNVQEVFVGSPLITVAYASDGTSNLDPLLKSTSPPPPAGAKPDKQSGPIKINLQKLTIENGALRYSKTHDATHKDVSEIAPLNVSLSNVQNGQTGKLVLDSALKVLNNQPSPGTNGTLEAKLNGTFDLTLSADAKPAAIQGAAKFEVGSVAGLFAQLAGFKSEFACSSTPSEVKEIALRLFNSGTELGQLRAHGPLSLEKQEGKLTVELVGIDRKALNLFGATKGIDFGPTTIQSTNEVQLADGGKSISLSGQFLLNQLQVTQTNQTSPSLDLRTAYQITVNQAAGNVIIKTLDMSGTQNQVPFLKGGLNSPMTIPLGDTKQAMGDWQFNFDLADFDLGPWHAFAGDALAAGRIRATLQILSQKGGDQRTVKINSSITNLVSGKGDAQMTLASATLQGQAQMTGTNLYSGALALTNLSMLDKKTKKHTTPLEASVQFDLGMTNNVLDIKSTSLSLTPTARAKNMVNLAGRIDMANPQAITGNLALTAGALDFTRYFDLFSNPGGKAAPASSTPAEAAPEKEPEPMALPLTNFVAKAQIGVVYLREVVMSNIVTTVSLNGSKIDIQPMALALNGAPMNGTVHLDLGVPGFKYDVSFQAAEVPFAPLVNTFVPDRRDEIHGTISAQAKLTGIGSTGASLQKHLAGNFDIATTNLNLALSNIKSPLLKTIVRVISIVPDLRGDPNAALGSLAGALLGSSSSKPVGWSDDLTRSPIDVIQLKGTMGSGKIDLQHAFIQSPAFQADASGPLGLAPVLTNSTVNIALNIAVARSLAEKINFVPAGTPTNAAYVKLPNYVAMKGTVGEPKTDINKSALLGSALEQLGGKIPGVDKKTGDLIQGLGGLLTGRKTPATTTNAPATPSGTNQPTTQSTNPPAAKPATNASPIGNLLNDLLRPKK